jgi:outer membrane protein assembly factor BamA
VPYRHSTITRSILLFVLLLIAGKSFAQDSVVINEIVTEIDGNTRRNALLKELRIEEGKEFDSMESLERLLAQRIKGLKRRRLFKEFNLDIMATDPGKVNIHIDLVDSFTILPRPMIKYSSTNGITLGLKVDYLNAFGTLIDHMIQGYWSPVEILFEYRVQNIVLGPFHMHSDFIQYDGTVRYGDPEGNLQVQYRYSSSTLSATLDVPLASASPWSYHLTPLISWVYDYRFEFNYTPAPDDYFYNYGFSPGLNHGFVTDQVDWVGNFRRGFYFDFMNNNLWYTGSNTSDIYLESDLRGYRPLASWFELSGRVAGFYAFDNPRRNAGDRLRGVLDYMTYGQWGNYLTVQANFQVFKTRKGLALHLRPFVDLGYVYSELWGHGPDAWEYCAGATVIVYLEAIPSLTINVDWGWDFKRNNPELIIETVHFL